MLTTNRTCCLGVPVNGRLKSLLVACGCVLCALILSGCSGERVKEKTVYVHLKDVPSSDWDRLSRKKVYFGHQSVGYDLLEGVRDVMRDNPQIKLNIVESREALPQRQGALVHSKIGRNADPKSKMDDFSQMMEKGSGMDSDIAVLKLCFVDILPNTDPAKVMEDYESTVTMLKKRHPRTTFVHVTVPLTAKQSWLKEVIKDLVGKMNFYDNVKRNVYNDLLRQKYGGTEPFFDLAALESTFPDGSRSSFTKEGRTYYSLVPAYTHDGGHLNETGRRLVAEQLLVYLARLSQ